MPRRVLANDVYALNADGSLRIAWVAKPGRGLARGRRGCGAPVEFPGTAEATWSYDEEAGELTVPGMGAFMGSRLTMAANSRRYEATASITRHPQDDSCHYDPRCGSGLVDASSLRVALSTKAGQPVRAALGNSFYIFAIETSLLMKSARGSALTVWFTFAECRSENLEVARGTGVGDVVASGCALTHHDCTQEFLKYVLLL